MDELWSFVDDKGHEQWVWLAINVETREIVGCYIGDRSGESAQALWRSLPAVYRQCAVCYSDFWVSYPVALPSSRQMPAATLRERTVGKESGLTCYIVRVALRSRTIQQHAAPTGVPPSPQNLVVLEEVGQSHPGNLELHPPLQRTTTTSDDSKSTYFPFPFLNGTTVLVSTIGLNFLDEKLPVKGSQKGEVGISKRRCPWGIELRRSS